MKFYINGIRRGLGKYLHDRLNVVETLEECDIFINCKHDKFKQVDLLYKACELGKRVISIGSYASDWIYHPKKDVFNYAVEKKALRDANSQLFDNGHEVCCLNLGYIDTERSCEITESKMTCKSVLDNIEWLLLHPHRIKEITITPRDKIHDDRNKDDSLVTSEQLRVSDNLYDYTAMYATQHKQLPNTYDIAKIQEEINTLKDIHGLSGGQLMLQSLNGEDFYTGLFQLDRMPEGNVEADFNKLNIPDDWEMSRFIKEEGLTRTRLIVMEEKQCYTMHFDPTPRIHLVIKTNPWSFMTDNKWKLFHIPADGHPYYFDTTKAHTAINSALEDRIHIVGIAPLKLYK
tara:strand:+ start:3546 stop:4583 length:1038 start_codon:yes stop_codon:yes gene_type:complete